MHKPISKGRYNAIGTLQNMLYIKYKGKTAGGNQKKYARLTLVWVCNYFMAKSEHNKYKMKKTL